MKTTRSKKEILYQGTTRNFKSNITIWLSDETRDKWDFLKSHKIRVAEHIRQIIDPELDRLMSLHNQTKKENATS